MSFIAFDTETYLIVPGQGAPKMVCLTWAMPTTGRDYVYGIMVPTVDGRADAWSWGVTDSPAGPETSGPEKTSVVLLDALVDMFNQGFLVGHNTAYDICVLMANYPDLQDIIWDAYDNNRVKCTMVREMLIAIAKDQFEFDPAERRAPKFSLAECARKRCAIELDKSDDTWRLRYSELDGIPLAEWPEKAWRYAVDDAVATMKVWQVIEGAAPKDEWLQVRAALALQLMGIWGMATDQVCVEELKAIIEADCLARQGNLLKAGLLVEERGDQKRKIKLIQEKVAQAYTKLGKSIPRNPPTEKMLEKGQNEGNICYDGPTLQDSKDPDLVDMAEYTGKRKIADDFLAKLTPTIHPWWKVLVRSGRAACANPPLQQIPRGLDLKPEHWMVPPPKYDVRWCFVPRVGYLYLDADYGGIENCTLAEICEVEVGFSTIGQILRSGVDLHYWMAQRILELEGEHWEYDELVRVGKDKSDPRNKHVKDHRQMSKAANFGLPGGLGADTFVEYAHDTYGVDITREKAMELKALWLATLPEMVEYFRIVADQGSDHVYVQHKSGRVRGGLSFCDGCNTKFQGLAADLAKAAMWELTRECYAGPTWSAPKPDESCQIVPAWSNPLSGCRPVGFFHDQFILEAPSSWSMVPGFEDTRERWGVERPTEAMYQRMVHVMKAWAEEWVRTVPIRVEGKISERWIKD